MDNSALANLIGYVAAIIGTAMFMPQAITIYKTKQTKGVSLMSFVMLGIVSCLWFVYGLLLNATPVILVNAVIAVLSAYIVYMKLKYK